MTCPRQLWTYIRDCLTLQWNFPLECRWLRKGQEPWLEDGGYWTPLHMFIVVYTLHKWVQAQLYCQWFLKLLSKQAMLVCPAAMAWFDREFKNHWLDKTIPRTKGTRPTRMFRESEINPFPAVSQYVHFLGVVGVNYWLNPYHSEQVCAQSQWFLTFLSKQPLVWQKSQEPLTSD